MINRAQCDKCLLSVKKKKNLLSLTHRVCVTVGCKPIWNGDDDAVEAHLCLVPTRAGERDDTTLVLRCSNRLVPGASTLMNRLVVEAVCGGLATIAALTPVTLLLARRRRAGLGDCCLCVGHGWMGESRGCRVRERGKYYYYV